MSLLTDKRIHILGTAGTLMGAFAAYLKRSGVSVTGSDQNIYPPISEVLKNAGVEVFTPYSAENIQRANPELVIVGNVIRKTNPEMEAVTAAGIPYMSLPQALETMILPSKHSIVVAGTHGKTTTSSMVAHVLEKLGENPSFFVGGVVKDFPESFRVTPSKYMVLEGDEYDTAFFDKVPKFVHYSPKDVILTSIEYDHADIYPNMQSLIAAFDRLAELTPSSGFFVTCAEYETTLRVAHRSNAEVVSYGFGLGVDSRASQVELSSTGSKFSWHYHGEPRGQVQLSTAGKHNVLNALGVLTLAACRGWNIETVLGALKSYQGVKRRQEVYGQANGVTLIDDFAHHPTAVRETIAGVRARYPGARLLACFEPRSATSRKKVFQQAYAESFDEADLIFVAKPYEPAGAAPAATNPDTFSTEDLLTDLQSRGKRAKILMTADTPLKAFSKELKSGDVVLVMSNGSFDGLLPRLLTLLKG